MGSYGTLLYLLNAVPLFFSLEQGQTIDVSTGVYNLDLHANY